MISGEDRNAVILSGGGAYASFEVGVLKALIQGESPVTDFQPLLPDIFTGTSAGAINAAILVSQGHPQEAIRTLEDTWFELTSGKGRCGNNVYRVRGNVLQFADPDCYRRGISATVTELVEDSAVLLSDFVRRATEFVMSREPVTQRVMEIIDFASFMSTERIKGVLATVVIPQEIRQSSRVLKVIATNWRTGQARVFGNEDFSEELGISPVLGSAAIPGIFPWHRIHGDPYVDGTVVENTPLLPSLDAGATALHLIEPPDPAYFPPDPLPSAVETFYRAVIVMLAVLMRRDIRRASEFNEGLELLERLSEGDLVELPALVPAARAILRSLARSPGQPPYRQIAIHRYIPTHQFGGLAGLLDFSEANISGMIEAGHRCATLHDCAASGCVLPKRRGGQLEARSVHDTGAHRV